MLKAGTFLTRAGAVAVTAATVLGVLAYEVDATAATSGSSTSRALPQGSDHRGQLGGDHRRRFRGRVAGQGNLLGTLDRNVKLSVNLITKGHFWDAGDRSAPDHLIPVWCIKKHRIGDVEAAEICRRREELRAEARERREKAEAKKAAKKAGGKSSRLRE